MRRLYLLISILEITFSYKYKLSYQTSHNNLYNLLLLDLCSL